MESRSKVLRLPNHGRTFPLARKVRVVRALGSVAEGARTSVTPDSGEAASVQRAARVVFPSNQRRGWESADRPWISMRLSGIRFRSGSELSPVVSAEAKDARSRMRTKKNAPSQKSCRSNDTATTAFRTAHATKNLKRHRDASSALMPHGRKSARNVTRNPFSAKSRASWCTRLDASFPRRRTLGAIRTRLSWNDTVRFAQARARIAGRLLAAQLKRASRSSRVMPAAPPAPSSAASTRARFFD
jgi:hypothetical protein